ncbi:hypothetical protein DPMN_002629 [Dreissena polymorpha]|uniref:Uncharacterized protein n=1 Tax=Dreissena polymorpha TaxID=45954 RepID=A0A9D4RU16_DREPO|nr:hypothetical protein DPMN_002629 [Dreissena polymorpha]
MVKQMRKQGETNMFLKHDPEYKYLYGELGPCEHALGDPLPQPIPVVPEHVPVEHHLELAIVKGGNSMWLPGMQSYPLALVL